jgi:hypothetical protein
LGRCSAEEQETFSKLRDLVDSEGYEYLTENHLLRYLKASKWNVNEAFEKISKSENWRIEKGFDAIQESEIQDLASKKVKYYLVIILLLDVRYTRI